MRWCYPPSNFKGWFRGGGNESNQRFISQEASEWCALHYQKRNKTKKKKRDNCTVWLIVWRRWDPLTWAVGSRYKGKKVILPPLLPNCHLISKSSQWIITLNPLELGFGNGNIKSPAGITSDSSVLKRSKFGPLGRNKTARTKLISAFARLEWSAIYQRRMYYWMAGWNIGEKFCLLHSQATTGSLCKRNQIPFHKRINVSEPTLGNKLVRFIVYERIRVHEICGHADWYLHAQSWLQIYVKNISPVWIGTHARRNCPLLVL